MSEVIINQEAEEPVTSAIIEAEKTAASAEIAGEAANAAVALAGIEAAQVIANVESDIDDVADDVENLEDENKWLKDRLADLEANVYQLVTSQALMMENLGSLAAIQTVSRQSSPENLPEEPEQGALVEPETMEEVVESIPSAAPTKRRKLI